MRRAPPGAADAKRETGDASTPVRTVKERLGSKASDDQRVDNCKVPLDLRGTRPRPDDCPDEARTASYGASLRRPRLPPER